MKESRERPEGVRNRLRRPGQGGATGSGTRGRGHLRRRSWIAVSGLAALWVVGSVAGTASAQEFTESARPAFRAETHPEGIRLVVEVPDGWALYAPVLPGEPAVRVGLPLRIEIGGAPVVPIRWPDAVRSDTPIGPARVHPAGTLHAVLPPIPGRPGPLQVTWALCSRDLCVPGRSRVALPDLR